MPNSLACVPKMFEAFWRIFVCFLIVPVFAIVNMLESCLITMGVQMQQQSRGGSSLENRSLSPLYKPHWLLYSLLLHQTRFAWLFPASWCRFTCSPSS